MSMRRGTEVARGYVGLEINGEGMNEDIVDEVGKAKPGVEKAGKEHGEAYGDEFKGGFFSRVRAGFQKGLAQELQRRAEKDGRSTGDQYGSGLVKGLRDRLDGAGFGPLREKLIGDIDAISEHMDVLRGKLERSRSPSSIDRLTASLKESRAEATRLTGQLRTLATMEMRELTKGVSGNRGGGRGRDNDTIGDTIGGIFGAGSRSNVLNFFGKSLGNIINLTEKARKVSTSLFSSFRQGFSQAAEGASFLQKVMSGFTGSGAAIAGGAGRMFASLAASGPAAAVAIGVVILAMSALVSVASALLAILTALVATVASALVGAMAVGAGAILAVVAAGGLLTAAFMSMNDAQKRLLKDSFQPLRAEMVGLGQIMIRDMVPAFGIWSSNLQRALALAEPLAQRLGGAFARAGTILTASFSGPGFQALATSLGVYLPGIITRLSTALGGFLNGVTGIFAALMPYVLQFSGYLARVAGEFSRWANSAEGQNAIVDFTERALASLRSLWNFVREFTGFLFDVLFSSQAQGAGNGLFDGMARSFAGFREAFARAQADGSLQKWFDDAIEFGGRAMEMFEALYDVIRALYSSGVLDLLGYTFSGMAKGIDAATMALKPMIDLLDKAGRLMGPLAAGLNALGIGGGGGGGRAAGSVSKGSILSQQRFGDDVRNMNLAKESAARNRGSASSLMSSGYNALANTTPKQYVNPYQAYARSLMDQGPSIAAQIRKALRDMNNQIKAALKEVSKADTLEAARSSLTSIADSIKTSAESAVNTARQALNSAAQTLASAGSAGAAARALKEVKAAQKALAQALANQKRLEAASKKLTAQRVVSIKRVNDLLAGKSVRGATLGDYALARERLAVKIDEANQKLADAIAMRSDYKNQVEESIKSFGSLLTAQAQTIDGVEQALTAGDITANLQDRLTKIRAFNDNLRILLAQGLSNDAYKQIVDAGVEGGSAAAAALVAGGQGAVQQVNSLTQQINDIATSMGSAASSRLYDAGVQAAKGLVDGLTSLSAQLDSAAAKLGESIAASIRRSLGIHSPSRVMYAAMKYVGDGIEDGLDDQHSKVGRAADRLSDRIRVSPQAAAHANGHASFKRDGVSGNDQKFRDLIVHTPTEDPAAVAQEVVNEIVGRL